ncbi:unnamed protein product [Caenorhabditis angaria]|uniref:Uncharacterized protein n=1 Tax=Caenorhabditis angaria TaxID=860376 RepID=A0A9P1I7Q3_9PELO|nr:unnamed protein product [Caenorhabditis angaria]
MYSKKFVKKDVEFIRSDHIVPIGISTMKRLREDSVQIGRSKFVRLQICSKIHEKSLDLLKNRLRLKLDDDFWIDKAITTTFPREFANSFKVNDFVMVCGKARLEEDGTPYLNAFSVRKVSQIEQKCFEQETKLCSEYYSDCAGTSYMPKVATPPLSTELNLGVLGLSRFPIGMLENCTVKKEDTQKSSEDSFEKFGRELAATSSKTAEKLDENNQDADDSVG